MICCTTGSSVWLPKRRGWWGGGEDWVWVCKQIGLHQSEQPKERGVTSALKAQVEMPEPVLAPPHRKLIDALSH